MTANNPSEYERRRESGERPDTPPCACRRDCPEPCDGHCGCRSCYLDHYAGRDE